MRRSLLLLLAVGLFASFSYAETRWCSIIGRGSSDTLVYPPIAVAARVQGIVVSRIQFSPSGSVNQVERISGSPMLAELLANQIKKWTLKTDATIDELCQSIVVASFRLNGEFSHSLGKPVKPNAPSVYEITVEIELEPIVVNSETIDPVTRGTRFRMAFHRTMKRIFG